MHGKTIDNFPNMKKKKNKDHGINYIPNLSHRMRYRDNQELEIIFRKYITDISTLQYN